VNHPTCNWLVEQLIRWLVHTPFHVYMICLVQAEKRIQTFIAQQALRTNSSNESEYIEPPTNNNNNNNDQDTDVVGSDTNEEHTTAARVSTARIRRPEQIGIQHISNPDGPLAKTLSASSIATRSQVTASFCDGVQERVALLEGYLSVGVGMQQALMIGCCCCCCCC
jgi:hypothetical protein